MNESKISAEIIKMLKTNFGCVVWKHWQGPMSKRGVSDILGCLPGGRMLAIEVKRPDGNYGVTEAQQRFLHAIAKVGGISFVARSPEEVKERLAEIGVKPPQQELF